MTRISRPNCDACLSANIPELGGVSKHARIARFILVFFIAALMLACSAAPAYATGNAKQVVKVGVYGSSIYAYQGDDGVWRGIDIECLTNIAQREGLELEFIDSVNDPDFLTSLEKAPTTLSPMSLQLPKGRAGSSSARCRLAARAARTSPSAPMMGAGIMAISIRSRR